MPRRQQHPKTCDTDTTPTEQPQTHDWRSTADAAANIPNSLYVSRAGVYDPPDDSKKKKWFNRCRKLWQVSNPVLVVVMAVLLLYFAGKYTEEMGKLQARVQELEQDNKRITTSAAWSPGPPGPIGPPGPSGEKGAVGAAGPTGNKGAVGPAGPKGKRGAVRVGPAGPMGEKGAVGPAGPTGNKGAVGPTGPTGKRGAVGPAGPKGRRGAVGPAGPTGKRGAVGPAGPTGRKGAMGPAGPTGRKGAMGPVGPRGRKGAVGPAGPTGEKGAMGPAGPTGEKGPIRPVAVRVGGSPGAFGPPGMSPGMPRRPERGSPCPEDGYKVYRGTCYKAFNTRKTFSDAGATCRQNGGTLAMPKDRDTTPTEQPQTHDWRSTADAAANIPNSLYVSRAGVCDPPDDSKKKKWFNRCRKLWQVSNPVLVVVMAVLLLYFAGKYTEEMGMLQARVQELERDNERITTEEPWGQLAYGKNGAVAPAGLREREEPWDQLALREKGAVGPAGPKGKRGAVGPAGPKGGKGAMGPPGPTGEKGPIRPVDVRVDHVLGKK
ncbi:PREDICTED: collagen alpha-2(I) chain-like [Branchiostoma belcheri]|uniref:Collagen alpha-2(I) chain-like n=1 Tax=Branchiostoma belcheri TaxID=7741 RepID=A0A6P5AYM3_BRABE|nr:PREDICTED: collagen alpha-2(I) chain-like [Branchiostoma belcheri]